MVRTAIAKQVVDDVESSGVSSPAGPARVGRVVAVSGSQAIIALAKGEGASTAEMGAVLTIKTDHSDIIGIVSALSVPVPAEQSEQDEIHLAELELIGELGLADGDGPRRFRRGISVYPGLSASAYTASRSELRAVYAHTGTETIAVGTLHQDSDISAQIAVRELADSHFVVLGDAGTGKSCAVAVLLRRMLETRDNMRVVLVDPNNKYAAAFQDAAEPVSADELELPHWLFEFDEIAEVLISDMPSRDDEIAILGDAITLAKRNYLASSDGGTLNPTTPYRITDMVDLLVTKRAKSKNTKARVAYSKLVSRLQQVIADSRFGFMFGADPEEVAVSDIIGRIFRIPTDDRPIATIDLSKVPSDAMGAVVSALCRMSGELARLDDAGPPIKIICDDAHRFSAQAPHKGSRCATRTIARIAKGGGGVTLGLVSARPGDLDQATLADCSTTFCFRTTMDRDRETVASLADHSLVELLPALGCQEAIVSGSGVSVPTRFIFSDLAEDQMPRLPCRAPNPSPDRDPASLLKTFVDCLEQRTCT